MGRLEGDLSVMPLADVVVWLANRRTSGHLIVEQETVRKEFSIHGGALKRAASNDAREFFGQFLLHLGLLTEVQLGRAYKTQKETDVLLGRILVMIGIVPEEQVIQTLRIKMAESLLDAFRWRWGHFVFTDAPVAEPRPLVDVAVPLIDLHREGIARAEMWSRFRRLFPDPSRPIAVVEDRVPPSATGDSLEARILELARQGLDMEAISLELHATDYLVASCLLELNRFGAVGPAPHTAPPPRQPSTSDPLNDAREAIDAGRLGEAMRHLRDGARLDPGNRAYADLRRDIEAQARELPMTAMLRDAVPHRARPPAEDELRGLSARERYVLGRVDGRRSVHAIIQVSPMHDLEALDIVRRLERDGLIRLV